MLISDVPVGLTGNIRVKKKKKNPKMRKKEVSGFSCTIPVFYSSVLPVQSFLLLIIKAEAAIGERLKTQILILEEQKKEVGKGQK